VTRSGACRTSSIVLHEPGAGPRQPDGPDSTSGRHAAPRPVRWHRGLLVALVAGALFAGATVVGLRAIVTAACAPVRVAAAPEIAPLVAQVAGGLDGCAFTVVPLASGAGSAALPGGSDPPHVWLPESSSLLRRAREQGATGVPASGVSVAASPVVMALSDATVAQLGPGRPTCDALFRADHIDKIVFGAPDPAGDPVGLGALLEAQADIAPAPGRDATLAAFLRGLQGHVVAQGEDLPTPGPARATALATTEQELLRHNVAHPDDARTAAYPDESPSWMDYPFTVLGAATPAERDAAARLLAALRSPAGQAALGAAGFRTPDGLAVTDRPPDGRTVRDLPAPTPFTESAVSDAALQRWATATRSGRVEVLVDISGSMNAIVPKLGKTRLATALDATTRGLTLFGPATQLGLWTFAERLDGDRDYRQVVPVTPIAQLLNGQTEATLRAIRAVPGGHTGLYDSVLALYEQARQSWQPGRLNVVVVLTDGQNDDPVGISHAELLRRLAAEADPHRPVTVVGVAIGPDVDPTELDQIARATGGRSFVVTDPSRVAAVFFTALGALSKG
jgi:Bacterial extracellular solute-binding protein/von Willebrand factor type A domain